MSTYFSTFPSVESFNFRTISDLLLKSSCKVLTLMQNIVNYKEIVENILKTIDIQDGIASITYSIYAKKPDLIYLDVRTIMIALKKFKMGYRKMK